MPTEQKTFLGKAEVKQTVQDGNFVDVVFVDDTKTRLHQDLYAILKTDKESESSFEDMKFSAVSKILLAKLREYGFLSCEVKYVGSYMENHAANAHDEATAKLWGGKHFNRVSLEDIAKTLESEV